MLSDVDGGDGASDGELGGKFNSKADENAHGRLLPAKFRVSAAENKLFLRPPILHRSYFSLRASLFLYSSPTPSPSLSFFSFFSLRLVCFIFNVDKGERCEKDDKRSSRTFERQANYCNGIQAHPLPRGRAWSASKMERGRGKEREEAKDFMARVYHFSRSAVRQQIRNVMHWH